MYIEICQIYIGIRKYLGTKNYWKKILFPKPKIFLIYLCVCLCARVLELFTVELRVDHQGMSNSFVSATRFNSNSKLHVWN